MGGGSFKKYYVNFFYTKTYLRSPRSERGPEGAFQIKKNSRKKLKKKDRKMSKITIGFE